MKTSGTDMTEVGKQLRCSPSCKINFEDSCNVLEDESYNYPWCAPPCSTKIGGGVAKISGGGGVRRRGLRTIGSFSCVSVVTQSLPPLLNFEG